MEQLFLVAVSIDSLFVPSAYWNATRAFMILSAMSCFAGIIAGILSFAHFSAFERFNRSFAAGIMFFVSSECWWSECGFDVRCSGGPCRETSVTTMCPLLLPPPPHQPALFVLLAMAIYTGVTVNFLGKRFGDWRFSWSYILGWVALLMTFFAGLCKGRGGEKKRKVLQFWPLCSNLVWGLSHT